MNDRRIEWLENVAHVAGVTVEYTPTSSLDGYYEHSQRRIIINSRLSTVQTVGVLAHELIHALQAHDGPQSEAVESRVDRFAARLLVSPAEYEQAERLCGPHAGAIARELDLPRWVVQTWQEQAQASAQCFARTSPEPRVSEFLADR